MYHFSCIRSMVFEKFSVLHINEAQFPGNTSSEVKIMMKTFLLGAVGYPLLELLYRRRTHYSMAVAGGFSLLLIRQMNRMHISIQRKAIVCGCGITAIEYLCGRLWNKRHNVWDYRSMPYNIQGQICLPYSLLWCGLSAVILSLDNQIKVRLAEK